MRFIKILIIAVAVSLSFAACGGKSKNKITLEEAKGPGRDKELFRESVNAIRKGNYDTGRILLSTLINTYPESPLVKAAKIAAADSFYLEGGTKNLAQAEVNFREFIEFFPDDPLAIESSIKMAEIHLKQVQAADRDTTHAKLAERQLKETLRRYPNTDKKEKIEDLMTEVQEILALHELKVGQFYFDLRQSMQAAQMRSEEILNKYPNFSRFDEALWLHAQATALQEDTETASQDLTRLVVNFPHSKYHKDAQEMLKKFGKAVPEPDPAKVQDKPETRGLLSRTVGIFTGPKIDTSNKGVIIDRELKTDEIIARAVELAGAPKEMAPTAPGATTTTNQVDNRPRRATGASQDVEVKSGSSPAAKEPPSSTKKDKEKDKKKKGEEKKSDNKSPVLRNP
jgi:outer membrane protein assembly factor BamD